MRPLMPLVRVALLCLTSATLCGCFAWRGSSGGGQTQAPQVRRADPQDIAVPAGYRVELVATHLTFPTGVAFDDQGGIYVIEAGYSYGEAWTTPRLLRINPGGRDPTVIATGEAPPWTGIQYHQGAFYVAEGGEKGGGRIVRIDPATGAITPLIENLPSLGDHHTNGPVIGPDGLLYFAIGTATNSAVVGTDNADFGWLKRHPTFHDIPGRDIKLRGRNFTTPNPLSADKDATAVTGAYLPFGTPSTEGQVVSGQVPCSGSIERIPLTGDGKPQLVAWGLRNPFGLAFSPDGQLYVTENAYDVRGSRPVWGCGDVLWRITPGTWYGWPDFHAGEPLTWEDHYKAPGKPAPGFVLAEHPNPPPKPAAIFGVHSSSSGLDFSRNSAFGHQGQAFVAQFGDMAPQVGKVEAPVGFKVVRVDVSSGVIEDFAANRGQKNGPASLLGTAGLERPTAVRFDPTGTSLYVVDFGVLTVDEKGAHPQQNTGVLWRIVREGRP